MHAEGIGRIISPETLRRRISSPGDKLAKHYDILFRELSKRGRLKTVLQAHEDLATIGVKTSPYETD